MSIDSDPPSPRPESTTHQQPNPPPVTLPSRHTFSRESSVERDDGNKPDNATGENDKKDEASAPDQTGSIQASQPGRRLSVQDRINLFENKQKENSGGKPPVVKSVELRRLSSDVSMMGAAAEKAVLRRWSGVSEMSIDLSVEKMDSDSPLCTPSTELHSQDNTILVLNNDTAKISSMVKPESNVIPSESRSEISRVKNQGSLMAHTRPTGSEGGWQVHIPNPKEGFDTRGKSFAQSSLTSTWKTMEESWVSEGVSGSRLQEAVDAQLKEIEDDSSSAQQESRSTGETEVEKTESVEDSGPRRMKFNRKVSAADLGKNTKILPDGSSRAPFSGKVAMEAQEGFDSFATPPEQFQRGRQTKGNQDRNDELKMKANELEKLFAEHKLRVPADLSNSARKGKLDDAQHLPVSSFQYSKPIADISPQPNEPAGNMKNKTKLNASSSMKVIDSQQKGDALKKSFSELSVSEGSRGKLYHRYIQKRDEKLKEDWSSNRTQKEARLKSMQDSLERNKFEMKAKLSGSAHRQSSVSSAPRRAERLRSYNSRSILNREQVHLYLCSNKWNFLAICACICVCQRIY